MKGDYVAVVGGVNIDICGRPSLPPVAQDSNPGKVTLSLGGVGRNIAHNMALLGLPVTLFTVLGDDPNAARVENSCRELGIDLSPALRLSGETTSTYLFITDHRGEMELAVSDMDIYRHLTPAYLKEQLPRLDAARLVVADANIPAASLAFLAEHCAAPLFVDPVSTAKAEKLRPILGKLHTLKPNRLEAALLSGVDIVDEVSLQLAAGKLLEAGLARVFISLGEGGALCADHRAIEHLPIYPGEMRNTTGCGDAFMAALAWAFWHGKDLADSGRAGLAAASVALAGAATINPAMSEAALAQVMGKN